MKHLGRRPIGVIICFCWSISGVLACAQAELELWAYSEVDQSAMLRQKSGEWLPLSVGGYGTEVVLVSVAPQRIVVDTKSCAGELWFTPQGDPPYRARRMDFAPEPALQSLKQQRTDGRHERP